MRYMSPPSCFLPTFHQVLTFIETMCRGKQNDSSVLTGGVMGVVELFVGDLGGENLFLVSIPTWQFCEFVTFLGW